MTHPPRRINDRYDLGETLGFGGMSEVHLARDTRLSRDVAIKVLRADLARDPTFYERFRREAQNAASLNHPMIVQVYDTGEAEISSGSLPYIVMEFVDGETLRDVLRRDGSIAPKAAMTWMADVCAALDFSHRNGIVHRDMKPANVMLNRTGEIKVMDFGIARAISDPSGGMTGTAAVIGTAQYLSPEQARGESVDARSDVYAAGCVLFELLTGQPPFVGDSPVAVAYQHVREDPPTPSSIDPDIPPELDSITLKALAKNPANRYQTAGEMRQDLIRVLAGQRPEAPMVLTDEERDAVLADPGRRRRQSQASPAAAVAGGGGGGRGGSAGPLPGVGPSDDSDDDPPTEAVDAVPPRRAARSSAVAENPKRRVPKLFVGSLAVIALILVGVTVAYLLNSPDDEPQPVTVTSQIGQNVNDAQAALQKLGFTVQVRRENNNTVPTEQVISTLPGPNAEASPGSTVILTVSSGPKIVPVPDVAGNSEAQARDALQKAGFTVASNVTRQSSSSVPAGSVISTNPAIGANTPQTTPIALTVSTGPEQVQVPDVTNTQIDRARSILDSVGLNVRVNEVESSQPVGTVLKSTPAAGGRVNLGSTVNLDVAKEPPAKPVSMPNLVGQDVNAARATLLAAGIAASNISVDRSVKSGLPWDDNKVWSTDPRAGTQINTDSSVTIRIRVPR